jgi:ABC-type Mn2+/Zn2+ transport system permease subunit
MYCVAAIPVSSDIGPALVVAAAISIACAVLSVFVVARRWAFIGEGISHSGFGGAGTAWLLALAFPATFDRPWMPYAGVVAFSLATALAIGYLTRRQRVDSDTAIGIFLVASLAWGFLAQNIYFQQRLASPPGWETLLFGRMADVSWAYSAGAVLVCLAVIATVAFLGKEILYYCFDPNLAEASGVPARFVHYLLMLLVALTIVIGVRVAGNVLVAALLVLPGATAMQLSDRLRTVMAASVLVGLTGALAGLALRLQWPAIPTGPAIVLVLFLLFAGSFGFGKLIRRRA